MKFSQLSYLLLSTIPAVLSYTNTYTGEVTAQKGIPQDCQTLLKIYDHFKLSRPGFVTGEVMISCCYYESRRLHSMDTFATTEWECENDSQVQNNHITSIILNGKNLSGEIPWDLLASLKSLKILYLNNNKLTGEISNISKLSGSLERLNLSNNNLSGSLPSNIPSNIQLINVNNNKEIKGPLPETWSSRKNFQCLVPSNVCKPKSLTSYETLCNTTPNSKPISECAAEQMITPDTNTNKNDVEDTKINNDNNNNNYNKDNNINNDVNNNSNENENTIENKINNNDNENIVNNKEESLQNSGEKKKSRAALYMFLSIIVILAIIISLVACFAKFKNVKHEKAMKQSLLHNRMMLQKYKSEEDTFFKDTAVRSMDDQFTLSKYSGSVYTDSGSNSNSHSDSGNRSKLSNINTSNYEHAILMQNIDGIPQSSTPKDGNDEYDNDSSNTSLSRTIDLSFTDASYSLTTNPYTSSCYDSSYCSTCDVSHSTEQSSFTSEIDSSISLSCHNSNYMSSYSYSNTNTTKNTNTVEDNSSNITLDSSIGDYGYDPNKNYLTKRSIVSNTSGRTLINRTGSSNAGTSTSSVLSSTGTVTTAATKFMEEENMKMVLEDIAEENSAELSRINNNNNQTIDLSLDDSSLGKGLNISYIFKDSSFFNDTPKKEESLTLNW